MKFYNTDSIIKFKGTNLHVGKKNPKNIYLSKDITSGYSLNGETQGTFCIFIFLYL